MLNKWVSGQLLENPQKVKNRKCLFEQYYLLKVV